MFCNSISNKERVIKIMGKKICFMVVLVMFLLLFSIFTVAENWRNDGAAYRVKIHAQCGDNTPSLVLCWDKGRLYQRTSAAVGLTGREWRNIEITDTGGLKQIGVDFTEHGPPSGDTFDSKIGAKQVDYLPAELRHRAPIDSNSREMTPEKHAILELAARDASIDAWQVVVKNMGDHNIVFKTVFGTEVTEFVTAWEAAENPYVKRAIVRRLQETAKSRGYYLSNQDLNEFATNAYNKLQPSSGEVGAMLFSGTTKALSEGLAIAGQPTGGGGKIINFLGAGIGKDVVHTANKVSKEDYVGAAANIFATTTMKTLPLGMGKLAQLKMLEPVVHAMKGWIDKVPTILANSPYARKILKGTIKKGEKTTLKYVFMGMVAAGEDIGLTKSEREELGYEPTIEFYKFDQAPMDRWANIDSGVEGFVYMKAYDSDGELRVFAKDKNEIIQRQVDDQWSVVKSYEPISSGSREEQFDQAPTSVWSTIPAGVKGWHYRKVETVEGSGEYVVYSIDTHGVLRKQKEDGSLAVLSQQEQATYQKILIREDAAIEIRMQEALAKFEIVEGELPPSDSSYTHLFEDWTEGGVHVPKEFREEARLIELEEELRDKKLIDGASLVYGDVVGKGRVRVNGVIMSMDEYARRVELKNSYSELKDVVENPSEALGYHFAWTIRDEKEIYNAFNGVITITTADGERKITFDYPGAFLDVLADVEKLGIAREYGSTIPNTIQKLKAELEGRLWKEKKKEDQQLAFRDQSAPDQTASDQPTADQPPSICEN